MRDFDDNEFPLAYLITFRCYGTWLHGDERGSYRRSSDVIGGVIRVPPRPGLKQAEAEQLRPQSSATQQETALFGRSGSPRCLFAPEVLAPRINVRSNHAHTVVSAMTAPEPILDAFKSYSTRALRKLGLLDKDIKPWARHGSTIYLWKEEDVARAVDYVVLGQDHPFK